VILKSFPVLTGGQRSKVCSAEVCDTMTVYEAGLWTIWRHLFNGLLSRTVWV